MVWFLSAQGVSVQQVEIKPVEVAIQPDVTPHTCPLDRYFIDNLAQLLSPFLPDLEPLPHLPFPHPLMTIEDLLRLKVNYKEDKIASNLDKTFTPNNSISGFEAYRYSVPFVANGTLQNGSQSSNLAKGLFSLFFGNENPLKNTPASHEITFKKCHDGDTCTIIEEQNKDCRISKVIVSARVSGIDAPEIGPYYIEGKPNTHSPKLVTDTNKLREKWLGNTQLSDDDEELKLVNKFIAMHVDYTGKIATIIRNDLNEWNATKGEPRIFEESQIQWSWEGEGDKTPKILCGTWQPFDIYGRRLGSFYQKKPSFLGKYLSNRLSVLMATDGKKVFEEYKQKIQELIQGLKKSKNPKVLSLVKKLGDKFPNPEKMFSVQKTKLISKEYQAFVTAQGSHYLTDVQLFQIMIGSVYAYEKYRNQDGDIYQAANDIARKKGFGFWTEDTFKTIYKIHEKDPLYYKRYHPPHCQN